MSRVAASLSYLVIYNATLKAPEPIPEDDDDAQENAQILFYTASERLVSRDRMLRQVGLARALVNFTETFSGGAGVCDTVHAQGKRLIMLSPEPDYWFHASVDVARSPRPTKAKAGESSSTLPVMQHHEYSVHDAVLRTHLLQGYDEFKLLHGTFSSILAQTNGRQILERQLERFFTMWAWKWDIESSSTLCDHLGLTTHPHSKALSPMVQDYYSQLPQETRCIIVDSSSVIYQQTSSGIPQSLVRYLMSLCPDSVTTSVPIRPTPVRRSRMNSKSSQSSKGGSMGFFSSIGSMDATKWNWSGYLTFGARGNAPNSPQLEKVATETPAIASPSPRRVQVHKDVDSQSLLDALGEESVEGIATPDEPVGEIPANKSDSYAPIEDPPIDYSPVQPFDTSSEQPDANIDRYSIPAQTVDSPVQVPSVEFSSIDVFLPNVSSNPSPNPVGQKVHYLLSDGFAIAIVWPLDFPVETSNHLRNVPQQSLTLLRDLRSIVDRETTQSRTVASSTSKTQQAHHLLASGGTVTQGAAGFSSNSSFLLDCESLLDMDPESDEVFSRTTNPAHWYIMQRGEAENGNLYVEDLRKEASLVDVANEIATLRRRYNGS